jgi:hypothetical protein
LKASAGVFQPSVFLGLVFNAWATASSSSADYLDRSVPLGSSRAAVERASDDWHDWVAPKGRRFLRGSPGFVPVVPAGTPHAFADSSYEAATVLFQSAPAGHELYFEELAQVLRERSVPVDPAVIANLRSRQDIQQLTSLYGGAR